MENRFGEITEGWRKEKKLLEGREGRCGERKDIEVLEQKKNKRGWPEKVMLRQLWPPPRLGSFLHG